MVYLDYAANCPVDERVLDEFYDVTKLYYANPNSAHKLGIEAKKIIDESTKKIAMILGVLPEEIIYTSGASESNNLAIKGIADKYKQVGKHIISTPLEHSSIIAPLNVLQDNGFDVDIIPIQKSGLIDLDQLKSMIREDTILVSVCAVDSELGIKQEIDKIGQLLKQYPNCFFHTDAVQAIGKYKLDLTNIDLLTLTPHKFYGLNGIGALIKKKGIELMPIVNGGKSTTIYRAGTPIVGLIASFATSLELMNSNLEKHYKHIEHLSNYLKEKLKQYDNVIFNSTEYSIPHTINFSIKGLKANEFASALEKNNIYISTKSACTSDDSVSKSVYAISQDMDTSSSSLRVSISHLTTKEEIEEFLKYFDTCYKEFVK